MLSLYLDKFSGRDEADCILVVFLHACTNGQDVGVKDDVVWVESHLVDQQLVGTSANLHFALRICGLQRTARLSASSCVCLCVHVSKGMREPAPPRQKP